MGKHFIHYNRSWYSYSLNQSFHPWEDEVNFSVNDADGNSYEFAVRWYKIGKDDIGAKFECFDDSWSALGLIQDVLEAMRQEEAQNQSPMEFCNLLMFLGFEDKTQEEDVAEKV